MTRRTHGRPEPPMPTEEIIRRLEKRPYDRACREAVRLIKELTRREQ